LNTAYGEMIESGRCDGTGGLSPRSVRYCHAVIRHALADAVRWNLLVRNVADAANSPRPVRKAHATWSAAELRRFLEHVREDRLYAAWLLAASTGARRGEVLGLGWSDLDLDAAKMTVVRSLVSIDYEVRFSEPKTERGRRTIALDSATVSALRAHRKAQAEERLAAGAAWTNESGLLFTDQLGAPLHPQGFSQAFLKHAKAAKLPKLSLHGLRHTHATLALRAGVHPKVVSERLGHASVGFTLDVYTDSLPDLQESAAELVAALVFG
jgi:integrase